MSNALLSLEECCHASGESFESPPDAIHADTGPAIDRRSRLSQADFIHEYQIPRRAVILGDATKDWAARRWTPELLASRLGATPVEVRREDGHFQYRFDELAEMIRSSTIDEPAPYGRNLSINRDLPALWPDVQPRLKYATPNWKSSRLLPRDWLFTNGLEELFFGGPGAQFPYLHVDYFGMDGFISQLYGEKEFILFEPHETPNLYPSCDNPIKSQIDNIEQPNLKRFPLFARAKPIRFSLQPGETLYMPNGWWHTTRMTEVSITVITATWNRSNWNNLVREIWRTRRPYSRVKAALAVGYLTGVGGLLTIRDQFGTRRKG